MDNGLDPTWALYLLLLGAIATYFPRGLGVFISGRIQPNSPLFN